MNRLRAALEAGGSPLGGWCTFREPFAAEILAAAGLDWVLIDQQHGLATPDVLPELVRAVEVGGAAPVVRVGANDPAQIMKALDLGAAGVVVPLVESGAEAAAVARAMRYPPEGDRSFGPARPLRHPSRADERPLCLPMVETVAALAAVDDIAGAPGVDGVFFGAVDLGRSLGLGRAGASSPEMDAAFGRVVAACERHGVVAAAVAGGAEAARDLVRRGVRLVTVLADKALLADGTAAVLKQLRTPAPADRPQPGPSDGPPPRAVTCKHTTDREAAQGGTL